MKSLPVAVRSLERLPTGSVVTSASTVMAMRIMPPLSVARQSTPPRPPRYLRASQPSLHEFAPLLKRVAAPVGQLGLVADCVTVQNVLQQAEALSAEWA